MTFLKYIAMLMLTLSISVVGFSPAQARSECHMAVKMQVMTDCQDCGKSTKPEQKKNGCCDSAKCFSSSSINMYFPTMQVATAIGTQVRLLYLDAAVIATGYLNSQERPPKFIV